MKKFTRSVCFDRTYQLNCQSWPIRGKEKKSPLLLYIEGLHSSSTINYQLPHSSSFLHKMAEFFRKISLINFLTLCVLTICLTVPLVEARIRHYKWEVKYEFKSPDCYKKLSITINGRSPGPSIIARQGDTIVVELKNSLLTENIAIHWHGIRQVIFIIYDSWLKKLKL